MIRVKNISGGYDGVRIIDNLSFEVAEGELFGLIGPNGSGKTTVLKMISQILPIMDGKIDINGRSVTNYSPKELARLIAVLPQQTFQTFTYTVEETIALGRYAHQQGIFRTRTKTDQHIINQVMEQTGISHYAKTTLDRLSGGERQRVFLAQALAQEPKILLLDEPTNHLDLSFQKELLDVLKQWTIEKDLTVLAIFHDLNLASLYCDRLLLLNEGKKELCSTPDVVLEKTQIKKVYETQIESHPHPKVPRPQMMLIPNKQQQSFTIIDETFLKVTQEKIILQAPIPLKTMSSGITGSGVGWHRYFMNRHVNEQYECTHPVQEMTAYLQNYGFNPIETVSMMTAVPLENVVYRYFEENGLSIFIVITASCGHAIDASIGNKRFVPQIGTINTWIFVNGYLTDEAFIQALTTATEAKVKVFYDLGITDELYGTLATGTATDSILVAATQQGQKQFFAGTLTPLGRLIGKGIYKCMKEAVKNYLFQDKNND